MNIRILDYHRLLLVVLIELKRGLGWNFAVSTVFAVNHFNIEIPVCACMCNPPKWSKENSPQIAPRSNHLMSALAIHFLPNSLGKIYLSSVFLLPPLFLVNRALAVIQQLSKVPGAMFLYSFLVIATPRKSVLSVFEDAKAM